MALTVGSVAPDFRLASSNGGEVSLSGLRGRKVVLYFYPKDETPGCTREACDFRDAYSPLRAAGAEVLGVSKDSIGSHLKFAANHALPFPLLSDPDNGVAKAYGAFGEKVLYGQKIIGTIRSTYLIDEQGKVAAVWSPVKVDGHVEKVAAAVRGEAPPARPASATAGKKAAVKTKAPARKKPAPAKTTARRPAARTAAKKKATSPGSSRGGRGSSGRASTRRGSARRS